MTVAEDYHRRVMVRWLRDFSGLTQRELARRSGVSERTIRGLESGEIATPRRASLNALARASGLSAMYQQAFLHAWRPETDYALPSLSMQPEITTEEIVARSIIKSETDENLVASWTRFRVAGNLVRSIEADVVVQAKRDGVESYVIPYVESSPGTTVTPRADESTCKIRNHLRFPANGVDVFDFELLRPLRRDETAAISFELTFDGTPNQDPAGTTSACRLQHRHVPITVVEVVFEGPAPRDMWETSFTPQGRKETGRTLTVNDRNSVAIAKHLAGPGSYGVEWDTSSFPQAETSGRASCAP